MKIIYVSILFFTVLAANAQDARALARQNEDRAAANKAATEHINAAYTNNLPNAKGGVPSSSTSGDAQVKANIDAWWNRLQTDLKSVNNKSADPNAYGMLSDAQRNEFADTGNKRRQEVYYVNSVITRYHENLNSWLDKIRAEKLTCATGNCKDGIEYGKTQNFNYTSDYKNGMLNGLTTFFVKDPLIKQITLNYVDNVLEGQGTIDFHDGSYENLKFHYNILGQESALILPTKESFFFHRNNGKISGMMDHYHADKSNCKLLYRDDQLFTILRANHRGFAYPSKLMYTGNFYIYIKEETMRKLFNDAGDGSFYAGEFKKNSDTPHGFGTKAWESGTSYTGKVINGNSYGEGIMYYNEGGIYKGMIKNATQSGYGVYNFTNGDKYEGNFKAGFRHGKGVYTAVNGYSIIGSFKKGYGNKVKYYNNNKEEITKEEYYKIVKE